MIDDRITKFMNREVLQSDPDTPRHEVIAERNSTAQSELLVCKDGVPVGVISERDALCVFNRSLSRQPMSDIRAADIMATSVHTLPEHATLGEVIHMMNERCFCRVPIVDDKNRLSGIVHQTDLQDATNLALERRGAAWKWRS